MKKLKLCLVLVFGLLGSLDARAEWTQLGGGDGGDSYADDATIRRRGNMIKMWSLFDFHSTQLLGTKPYLSTMTQFEYDCGEERYRLLAYVMHAGHMGYGDTVSSNSDPGGWSPVPPGSIGETLWNHVCKP